MTEIGWGWIAAGAYLGFSVTAFGELTYKEWRWWAIIAPVCLAQYAGIIKTLREGKEKAEAERDRLRLGVTWLGLDPDLIMEQQRARDALAGGSDPLERLREHNRVSPAIFAEVAGGSVQESGCSETDSGWYWNKVEEVKKPVHEPCPVCGAIGNPRLQCDTCVAAMAQTCNHLWQKGSELCTRCGAKREYSDCDL